jgi:hypothetical protein
MLVISIEYVRGTDVSPVLLVSYTVDDFVGFYDFFNLCLLPSVENVRGTDVSPLLFNIQYSLQLCWLL